MPNNENFLSTAHHRLPWNKGKLIGARPPLLPKHVWSIRTRLLLEGRTRDLAMFKLAIDSKLRGYGARRVSVYKSKGQWPMHDDPPIRSASL